MDDQTLREDGYNAGKQRPHRGVRDRQQYTTDTRTVRNAILWDLDPNPAL